MLASSDVSYHRESDGYESLLQSIQAAFDNASGPLFQTDATNLWDSFLANIPEPARQHYTCRTCEAFVNRYGGLVRILSDGSKAPAVFGNVNIPDFFQASVGTIIKAVAKAKVTGVFVSSNVTYGTPSTKDHKGRPDWYHMAVNVPASLRFPTLGFMSADQREAELKQDYLMLLGGLREYPIEAVNQALKLLKTDALYRSEKVLGVAEWLKELHDKRASTRNSAMRDNITWLAVATAPAGFCHIKSTMIGTLLDDIVAGNDFDDVSRKFAAKMHPLQYQRPQAAPAAGAIAQAEKLMQQLGAAGALERRFARIEELQLIWKPVDSRTDANKTDGVFSHLTPKNATPKVADIDSPAITMTWDKFSKTVLPEALSIDFHTMGRNNYSAIVTATRDDAPPIFQWDSIEKRNPFSSYVYHDGSTPYDWNLTPGWVKVTGISLAPHTWSGEFANQSRWALLILDGARDTRYQYSGNAIFPETLKSEFHGIRSVIEAYSRSAVLGGYESASACGVRVEKGSFSILLRVKTALGVSHYNLDRWD